MQVERRSSRAWIAFVVVDSLVIFFGLSYLFFPMGTVVEDGNQTTGILEVPRELWGGYLVASALVMLVVAVGPFRAGRAWAWHALLYHFAFFLLVAAIEPDPVVPTIFSVVLAVALWRSRSQRMDPVDRAEPVSR